MSQRSRVSPDLVPLKDLREREAGTFPEKDGGKHRLTVTETKAEMFRGKSGEK